MAVVALIIAVHVLVVRLRVALCLVTLLLVVLHHVDPVTHLANVETVAMIIAVILVVQKHYLQHRQLLRNQKIHSRELLELLLKQYHLTKHQIVHVYTLTIIYLLQNVRVIIILQRLFQFWLHGQAEHLLDR